MSNNIEHVETQRLEASLTAENVVRLHRKYESVLAESNFLEEMLPKAERALQEKDKLRLIYLPNFWWNGSYSGRSLTDVLLKGIVPKIIGEVEAILSWEDGSVTGILVKNGKGAEVEVEQRLKKPPNW